MSSFTFLMLLLIPKNSQNIYRQNKNTFDEKIAMK